MRSAMACGVELLTRCGGNADIQATTIYTRLASPDLQNVVNPFEEKHGRGAR